MPGTEQEAKPGQPKKRTNVAEVWTEVCKDQIDKITERRTYEPWEKPIVGCRFYRFRTRGDTIEGILGKGIPNFRQGTSYPLTLNNGDVVEIVGNRILHTLINNGELVGQRVRIIYIGAEAVRGGHWRKIYRVYKVQFERD